MKKNKVLVVGAGFTGATIARHLADKGLQVNVIDKREHIAGNAYDTEMLGVRVHKYGPHIFHTNNDEVIRFVKRFGSWMQYEHKVVAKVKDKYTPFPPNRNTIDTDFIKVFYRPYTEKMWAKPLEEVAPNILKRVPMRDDDEDRYFPDDKFQGFPRLGYTALINNMLTHPNICVLLGTKFDYSMEDEHDHVFYTGAIDEYYKECYGKLAYRSIKFEYIVPRHELPHHYPVTNFTDDGPFTRQTEWAKFPGHGKGTLTTLEIPCDPEQNGNEKYYPSGDRSLWKQYKDLENEKVTFCGRLGNYVYINMDQAISSALAVARRYNESLCDKS